MKAKFNEMYETLLNGNISDFRQWLKGLTKIKLIQFAAHCAAYDLLDIYDIERHLTA